MEPNGPQAPRWNLTPHTINIIDGEHAGTYPSEGAARVSSLPLGAVIDLPEPEPDTIVVVSVITAEAAPGRSDLRVPGDQVRDDSGRIIGCRSLAMPADVSPALAILLAPRKSGPATECFLGETFLWGATGDADVERVMSASLDHEVNMPAALLVRRHLAEVRQGGRGDIRLAAAAVKRFCEHMRLDSDLAVSVLIEASVTAEGAHKAAVTFAGKTADWVGDEDADWRSTLASVEATVRRTMLIDDIRVGRQPDYEYVARAGQSFRWGRQRDKAHHDAMARGEAV